MSAIDWSNPQAATEEAGEVWFAVFHILDPLLGGDKSGAIAQICADAVELYIRRETTS